MNWWKAGIGIIVAIGVIGVGWYIARPVPGTKIDDQGREHVSGAEVAAYQYNSNPPTSGPHLETWVKAGIYGTAQSEGEMIHSLEHGYVIINYNCNVHLRSSVIPGLTRNPASFIEDGSRLGGRDDIIRNVFAHEESASAEATADKEGSSSADFVDPTIATGSAMNESDGCKILVKQLTEIANQKKFWKLIVVPRPQLDTTIALTAWNYIDKFDPDLIGVDTFDAGRIERFIDFHRDQGPEKTME